MRFDPTQVPTFPVEIGGELPASTVYVPGISLRDLGGVFPPLVARSLATIAGSSYGPALTSNSTGNDNSTGAAVVTGNYLGNIGQEVTIFWAGDQNSTPGNTAGSDIFGIGYDSTSNAPYHAFALAMDNAFNIQAICGIGSNYYAFTSSVVWAAARRQTWVGTVQMGGNINLYQNGVLIGTTTGVPSGTFATSTTSALRLGNYSEGGYSNANNAVAGFSNGIWTPAQVAQFAAEPFAMLRPVRRRTYFVPASSGASLSVAGRVAPFSGAIGLRFGASASIQAAAAPASGAIAITPSVPSSRLIRPQPVVRDASALGAAPVAFWSQRAAGDVDTFSVDFSPLLAAGEALTGAPVVTVPTGDLTVADVSESGSVVSLTVSGTGTQGNYSSILIESETTSERTIALTGMVVTGAFLPSLPNPDMGAMLRVSPVFGPRAAGDADIYAVDFSPWLDAGETIVGCSVSALTGDLAVSEASYVGSIVTWQASGSGTPGAWTAFLAVVQTSAGRTLNLYCGVRTARG